MSRLHTYMCAGAASPRDLVAIRNSLVEMRRLGLLLATGARARVRAAALSASALLCIGTIDFARGVCYSYVCAVRVTLRGQGTTCGMHPCGGQPVLAGRGRRVAVAPSRRQRRSSRMCTLRHPLRRVASPAGPRRPRMRCRRSCGRLWAGARADWRSRRRVNLMCSGLPARPPRRRGRTPRGCPLACSRSARGRCCRRYRRRRRARAARLTARMLWWRRSG